MSLRTVSSGRDLGQLGTLKVLAVYLWPKEIGYRMRILFAAACLVSAKICNLYVPIFYKQTVDTLSLTPNDGVLVIPVLLILAYGMARVLTLVFGELRDILFVRVGQRTIRKVTLDVFQHLHELSLRFHLGRQTGRLSRALERGNRGIDTVLRFMIFNILPTLIEICLTGFILWYLFNIWFALVTLITVISYITFSFVITEWRIQFRRAMNESESQANTKAIDSLLNYETVKYFCNEGHEVRRLDQSLQGYENAAIWNTKSLSLLNIGQACIISLGLTLIMYMAAEGIRTGTMTMGDFVLVNTYLIQLYLPLNFFGFVYREIKNALVDIESLFCLFEEKCEITDRPGAKALHVEKGKIVFDRVSFSYDIRRPILQDVSFCASEGQTVAFVGASGAGKSTIARLLFRFYDIHQGRILIEDEDVRDVTQASIRTAIGIVPQDTVLFNDTIFYNISYGRPGASVDEVIQVTRLAYLYDFIMTLPDGFQTQVGERGLKLSGGEKQRVSIARTMLKNPKILLFDEATSALDTQTEREIQTSLAEISQGRTTLVIAHRLSTIIDADDILVLDQGRIVERGRHTELLLEHGLYAAMWQRQKDTSFKDKDTSFKD